MLALVLEPLIAAKAKERQATSTGGAKPQLRENSHEAERGRTDESLAQIAGISSNTIRRAVREQHKKINPVQEPRGGEGMNKDRRQELAGICIRLGGVLSDLEALQAEEENSRDNTPENLQGTERYEESEAACDALADAVDGLNTAIDAISQITD